ncbi:MAG TPA: nucleotidyltransferase family protein [Candidatus Acidoferrum sp.]|nr:nucleotidyltransferase family protein [Candidatus Acidoferrum sp.]
MTALSPFGTKPIDREWKFLCACASPSASSNLTISELAAGLDWQLTLQLAEEHSVLGLVASRLRESGHAEMPAEAWEQLLGSMRTQHLFTLSMTAELFRILDAFAQENIETILVKGPVVSFLAFGDPAVRSYVDLDLLVRDSAILRASRILVALGFEPDVPEAAILAGKIPGEYLFRKAGAQQLVELHTEKTFRYYPRRMRMEDLFSRQRRVPLEGRDIPALCLEDEFVLNCIHGAKHFWERLMWPSDIAAIVARHSEISWERVRQAAREVGAERMVHVGLLLAESLLGVPVPAEMAATANGDSVARDLVRQVEVWLPTAGYQPPLSQRAMFRLKMGGGGLTGAAYLLRLSVSPTEEDWSEGKEERGSRLWEAIKRPFRLMRKYGQDG